MNLYKISKKIMATILTTVILVNGIPAYAAEITPSNTQDGQEVLNALITPAEETNFEEEVILGVQEDNTQEAELTPTLEVTPSVTGEAQSDKTNIEDAIATTEDIFPEGTSYTYTGFGICPLINTIKYDDNTTLTYGEDYTLTYEDNTLVGKATVCVNGTGQYTGTKTYEFIIEPADINDVVFTVDNGSIKGRFGTLIMYQDYDFEASEPSLSPDSTEALPDNYCGKAYITLTGKGQFKNSVVVSYTAYSRSSEVAYISDASLTLGGDIKVNFYFDLSEIDLGSDVESTEAHYMLINDDYRIDLIAGEGEQNDRRFSYTVAAKEMGKDIRIRLYDKDDKILVLKNKNTSKEYDGGVLVYHVRDYLENISTQSNRPELARSLAYYMSLYGKCAQNYFEYDTDSVSGYVETEEIDADTINSFKKHTEGTMPEGLVYLGSALLLDSKVGIRHYFTVESGYDAAAYKFDFGMESYTGDSIGVAGGIYYVDIPDIAACELGKETELKVTDNNALWTLYYSPMSYVYDVLSKDNSKPQFIQLCKSMYWYYMVAKEYLGYLDDVSQGNVMEQPKKDTDSFLAIAPSTQELEKQALNLISNNKITNTPDFCDEILLHNKNILNDWYSFQLKALESVPRGEYISYPLEDTDKEIRIYNTDGTVSGIYIYYGGTYEDGCRYGEGLWCGLSVYDNGDKVDAMLKIFEGNWGCEFKDDQGYIRINLKWDEKVDWPSGKGIYRTYETSIDKNTLNCGDEVVGTEYDFIGNCGDFNGNVNVFKVTSTYEDVVFRYYKSMEFKNGFISGGYDKTDDQGNAYFRCTLKQDDQLNTLDYSDEYVTYKLSDWYGIPGLGADQIFNTSKYDDEATNAPDYRTYKTFERFMLLKYAYALATSEKIDYDDWYYFVNKAKELKISYEYPVIGEIINSSNSVGIYGGYDSDDIYIYYGPMKMDSSTGLYLFNRVGSGKWMTVRTGSKEEEETGYTNLSRSYKITSCDWHNDVPCGKFTTELYTEVISSDKAIKQKNSYSGNLDNSLYNGEVIWTAESESKYPNKDAVKNIHTYKLDFDKGIIQTDNVTEDGYAYIDSTDGSHVQARMLTTNVYSVSGLDNSVYETGTNCFYDRAQEGSKAITEESASSKSLIEQAVSIATEKACDADAWNQLNYAARKAGITYSSPKIKRLSNGKYIGIYGAYDGENYYIYYGNMLDGQRSGQGMWLTGSDYSIESEDNSASKVINLDVYDGTWKYDLPNGDFTRTTTTILEKPEYNEKIISQYSGQALWGSFSGSIDWNIKTSITYADGNKAENVRYYTAIFKQGYIQGYSSDNVYVNIPEIHGRSEEKIPVLKHYGYGGLYYNNQVNGNSINYYDELSREELINRAYKLANMSTGHLNIESRCGEWNAIVKAAYLQGLTSHNPIIARCTDGKYIGLYTSTDNPDDVYMYYGEMKNHKRQGEGKWVTYSSEYAIYTQYFVESTWNNDIPNGKFSYTRIMRNDSPQYVEEFGDYIINNRLLIETKKYSGKTKNGLFDGNISVYKYRSISVNDSSQPSFKYGVDYIFEFNDGFIQSSSTDEDGYVYILGTLEDGALFESCDGITTEKIPVTKQYHIEGAPYISAEQ